MERQKCEWASEREKDLQRQRESASVKKDMKCQREEYSVKKNMQPQDETNSVKKWHTASKKDLQS